MYRHTAIDKKSIIYRKRLGTVVVNKCENFQVRKFVYRLIFEQLSERRMKISVQLSLDVP